MVAVCDGRFCAFTAILPRKLKIAGPGHRASYVSSFDGWVCLANMKSLSPRAISHTRASVQFKKTVESLRADLTLVRAVKTCPAKKIGRGGFVIIEALRMALSSRG
jgi:hypothetical protein